VLWRGPLWEEALELVELDLGEITAARVDLPMLSDLEQALPRLLESRSTWSEPNDCPDSDRGPPESTLHAPDRAVATGRALDPDLLAIDEDLVEQWLVRFLREEMVERKGFRNAVIALSGGVDSAVTAALCARALGPENVYAFLMPYRTSSPKSAEHAELVAGQLGIHTRTIDITAAADGYLAENEPEADETRRGNVMARQRMIVLFDQAAKLSALPVGTGNKSERLLGYFTWHADDSPPINPLGDLFKTQVWALARHLGLPEEVVEKPATADLVTGQTDEADLGVSYAVADLILYHLVSGRTAEWIVAAGFDASAVSNVQRRLDGTHWKRNLPTVAMLSATTIGEWYLRPVDY
jgi:NAD+ synthetase